MDMASLPLHTNKAVAIKAEKRKQARVSKRALRAIESGDLQLVIDSLSERQRRFCEEYPVDLNATQAVIRAGYKTKYPNRIAFQLMENPAVRISMDALRAQREKVLDVTKDYVLRKIVRTLEAAEQDEVKNYTAILRAAELLARHLGMFVDKTEISGPDGKEIEIKQKQIREEAESFLELIDRTAKKTELFAVNE